MKRRGFLVRSVAAGGAAGFGVASWVGRVQAADAYRPSVAIAWNQAVTSAIAKGSLGPTVAARALSMTFEAVYNAWAVYRSDDIKFTLSGLRKRSSGEGGLASRIIAVNQAAYMVLLDLFPTQAAMFEQTLAEASAGLDLTSKTALAAAQNGQLAGALLLAARRDDGSNQSGSYADTSGYKSVNTPDLLVDPMRWQPLRVQNAGSTEWTVQTFLTPHWGGVRPFALPHGAALRPTFDPAGPTRTEAAELLELSAALNNSTKCLVDFFANNPGSVTPPGQWMKFAELAAAADGNSLDDDVVTFFMLSQAMLDASIAAWDAKRTYDSVRPITTLRHLYRNQTIKAWGGVGTTSPVKMKGELWLPYQRAVRPTPNFPEFVSGHSTFSGAAAAVLAARRGDAFTLSFTMETGDIAFDPTMPTAPVSLSWPSFSAIAAAAGMSRRYGGIHFEQGDLKGRSLGRSCGELVLKRCRTLGLIDD